MNLGDAVWRAVAGRPRPREESPDELVARALREAGGVSQLARALGVARTTVQRWNRGATPTEDSQALLRSVLRRADASDARARRLGTSNALVVSGQQDGRHRTINLGQYLRPGTMGRAVEAYLNGADRYQLWVVVWSGITDKPYRWMFQPPGGLGQARPAEQLRAARRAEEGEPAGGGGPAGPSGGGGLDDEDEEDDEEYVEDLAYEDWFVDDLDGYGVT